MLNEKSTSAVHSDGFQVHLERGVCTGPLRYKHILVPIRRTEQDDQALVLGAGLAALHRATLTVLQIQPPVANMPSLHWLDAINSLYQSLDRNGDAGNHRGLDSNERLRSQIREILCPNLAESLLNRLTLQVELRTGDFADQVARFVDGRDVDLLIMPQAPIRWWASVLPLTMRQTLFRNGPQVILVGPDRRRANGVTSRAV